MEQLEAQKAIERKFQELLKRTIVKLLDDIKTDGFVIQDDSESEHKEYYCMVLGSNDKTFSVSLWINFGSPLQPQEFTLSAVENFTSSGLRRELFFSKDRFDVTLPFFSQEWSGAYLLTLEKAFKQRGKERESLSDKEKVEFLSELLSVNPNKVATQRSFEESIKENPNIKIFWTKNYSTKDKPFLLISKN